MADDGQEKLARNDNDGENEDDPVLSMVDYLKEEESLQDDAEAVLGDSDENQCTYILGYKGRQALYACSTCKTVDNAPAAVCLGCSYACHEECDLFELYTKRNVRCDCGNKKFVNLTCKLYMNKADYNKENQYNQNYKGLYCICNRPYPDPEDEIEDEMIQCVICEDWLHGRIEDEMIQCVICEDWLHGRIEDEMIQCVIYEDWLHGRIEDEMIQCVICEDWLHGRIEDEMIQCVIYEDWLHGRIEDEMIQCVICEDWLHGRHLGDKRPPNHFSEMICLACMSKHEFLWAYTVLSAESQTVTPESSSSSVDVEKVKTEPLKSETGSQTSDSSGAQTNGSDASVNSDSNQNGEQNTEESSTEKKEEVEQGSSCLLEDLKKRNVVPGTSATFWSDGYRSKFCTCPKCMSMYKDQNVLFLLDETDTVTAYEKRGFEKKAPASSQEDQEQQLLQGMNRVQQIEMVQGFNDLKSALGDYLRHFAENGKVVREEDIREFFAQMHARKRQKTDHTPGYFCR